MTFCIQITLKQIITHFSCAIQTNIQNVFRSLVFLVQVCLSVKRFLFVSFNFCLLAGALIVTTPQDVALNDARRGVAMFSKVEVPV